MIEALGFSVDIVSSPDSLRDSQRIILPGVGAFDAGMSALRDGDWEEPLTELALSRKVPILGICLGMQMLCRDSDEGVQPGLGWIEADVVAFDPAKIGRKVPHMGWAPVQVLRPNPILVETGDSPRFYHVHSYHAVCRNQDDIIATAEYGIAFTTAVWRDNILGVQFHPEKSHRYGMDVLRHFVNLE